MKKAATKKPLKALPRPQWKPRFVVFGIVTNKKFDMVIMVIILVNMRAELIGVSQGGNSKDFENLGPKLGPKLGQF